MDDNLLEAGGMDTDNLQHDYLGVGEMGAGHQPEAGEMGANDRLPQPEQNQPDNPVNAGACLYFILIF